MISPHDQKVPGATLGRRPPHDIDPDRRWRRYSVSHRCPEAADSVSFTLSPADHCPVPSHLPGQHVTVAVDLPAAGRQQRQYFLSQAYHEDDLHITVR